MANRTNLSMTPGRIRKVAPGISNSQTLFADDTDDLEVDENEFDENFPIRRDVSFFSQPQRHTTVQRPNSNRNTGSYYTPQTKRKRPEDNIGSSDSLLEQINTLQVMLKEINRKIDIVNQRDDGFEKKMDNIDKRINGLIRQEFDRRNLLSGPIGPTPAFLMKRLINELFTKEEIMNSEHEQINERTKKIKDAVQACFFQDDPDKTDGFWEYEGKIVRGNQRRGLKHRKKLSSSTTAESSTATVHDNNREPSMASTLIVE
ncbi:unnamed protein product [Rotaria magnacalcarata]|uniref:Uncharacterized protein n=1 Tax=Rotaria magnacalcarata TaxID=392030 RepID=A0A820ATQ8_9BILA|nr:unnamed protein product [Rotaria magnacalcarata]CAF4195839.1 unnamed protein product [Rotaria magnacalcarata]